MTGAALTGPGRRRPGAPTSAWDALVARACGELRSRVRTPDDLDEALLGAWLAENADDVLGAPARAALLTRVRAELVGAGPLQPYLDDARVTDVLVNGPHEVWVDRGDGLHRADVDLGTVEDVRALAVRLAAAGGQRLDDAAPVVDARLPDGTRLHAVLPPVAGGCAVISLRVLRQRAWTLTELVALGTVAPDMAATLRALVAVRANLLVAGATGTGKTTLLSSLLSLADPAERLVLVEEVAELAPAHPHVVRLTTRRPNVEGAGGVDLAELVRASLRMRPDRVVLGEARGAEVRDVLGALNTGHEGGSATLHANTPQDVPARLEALAALAGMPAETVAAQASSAFDAVLFLRRDGGQRRLVEIAAVERDERGRLLVQPALTWYPGARAAGERESGSVSHGPGWPVIAARLSPDRGRSPDRSRSAGRALPGAP